MTIPNDAISYLLTEDQNPDHTQRVFTMVQPLLMKDERIEYIGIEDKVLSLDIRPESVVLTNRRFLLYSPKLLGGATFEDYIWRDLGDCKLVENILRATLTFRTSAGKLITIENIPKSRRGVSTPLLSRENWKRWKNAGTANWRRSVPRREGCICLGTAGMGHRACLQRPTCLPPLPTKDRIRWPRWDD